LAGLRQRTKAPRGHSRPRDCRRPYPPFFVFFGPLVWSRRLVPSKPIGRKMPRVHASGILMLPFFCRAHWRNTPSARQSDFRSLRAPAAPREPSFEQKEREDRCSCRLSARVRLKPNPGLARSRGVAEPAQSLAEKTRKGAAGRCRGVRGADRRRGNLGEADPANRSRSPPTLAPRGHGIFSVAARSARRRRKPCARASTTSPATTPTTNEHPASPPNTISPPYHAMRAAGGVTTS
jgi:hypothetical protein